VGIVENSKPDLNAVTIQNRQACKEIFLQSNENRVNYSPTGKTKENGGLKYTRFISQLLTDKNQEAWKTVQ